MVSGKCSHKEETKLQRGLKINEGIAMNLTELAFACYIYKRMTNYDKSYQSFLRETSPQLDLNCKDHRMSLLKWLNAWGCRQFKKKYHEHASEQIREWYQSNGAQLFAHKETLLALTASELAEVQRVYDDLFSRNISERKKKNSDEYEWVKVGPTGTAKILYALRPNALIPWDIPMRKRFNLSEGSGKDYISYLEIVKSHIQELEQECQKQGFDITDLPARLDRVSSSIVKMIDEYFWITITNDCPIPAKGENLCWESWR